MDIFADEALAEDREISFSAGTHREPVRMSFEVFRRSVKSVLLTLKPMSTALLPMGAKAAARDCGRFAGAAGVGA